MQLKNAPLVHVVAQVVYSRVLDLGDRVADMQAAFRSGGFPRLEESQAIEISFQSGSNPQLVPRPRWDFRSKDLRWGVALTDASCVLQTTAYASSESFFDRLREVLEVVSSLTSVSIVERIGLRFSDVIRPEGEETFASFVKPGLLGFSFEDARDIEVTSTAFRTDSQAETHYGRFSVRCLSLSQDQLLPPDLLPSGLEIPDTFKGSGFAAALDFDHICIPPAAESEFAVDLLIGRFRSLHESHRVAFRAAVTPYAWSKWGPELSS